MSKINSNNISKEAMVNGTDAKKPIIFKRFVDTRTNYCTISSNPASDPGSFDNVRLIAKGIKGEYDVIATWQDNSPESIFIYLGHWNDGVIG
jgi:hypothetical protein